MKSNKKLLLTLAALCATSLIKTEEYKEEPVLSEIVESPSNIVGSLFGGGYASRKHNKNVRGSQESELESLRQENAELKGKKNKKMTQSKKNQTKDNKGTRRMRRRKNARSTSSGTTEE